MAGGDVIDELTAAGAKAVLVEGDIAERSTADALVRTALDQFGSLDIVVNNAGFTRDRMLFNMTDEEWDDVIRVHLRGHFLLSRNAAAHWRQQFKATGAPVYARLINTSSEAGLTGSEGQPNYAAAKAGIAALTVSTARALARLGVRANAICPRARTAMTAGVFGAADSAEAADGSATQQLDPLSVEHVAPLVAFLASPAAEHINGQVFVVYSGMVALMAAPVVETRFDSTNAVWTPDELAATVGTYFADRDPARTFGATDLLSL
jgi:3-oxoacyl-[acyl-carrier protein] reductase